MYWNERPYWDLLRMSREQLFLQIKHRVLRHEFPAEVPVDGNTLAGDYASYGVTADEVHDVLARLAAEGLVVRYEEYYRPPAERYSEREFYDRVKERLLGREIPSGEVICPEMLMIECSVNFRTVKNVLIRLQVEGLLRRTYCGNFVRRPTMKDGFREH